LELGCNFANKTEAVAAINLEQWLAYHYKNQNADGKKVYYRCQNAQFRGPQCDAGAYLWYKNTSEEVVLFRSGNPHSCTGIDRGLTKEAKLVVVELFDLNGKAKRILEKLREKNIPVRCKSQVQTYLNALKSEKYAQSTFSLGKLEEWCLNHFRKENDGEDSAVVIGYQVVIHDIFS